MASLDNFHTNNGHVRIAWPDWKTRMNALRYGVHNTSTHGDVAARVPVAPIQPSDPALRSSERPDPRYTERVTARVNDMYVPTRPHTQRLMGDTVEANLLYEGRCCVPRKMWNKPMGHPPSTIPIRTRDHRWQPY